MKIRGAMAVSVIFAAVGVGFASPSWADDFGGTYTLTFGKGTPATWVVTPCGGEPFIPCVHVAQTGGDSKPFEGDAHLTVGSWIMRVDRPDAVACNDSDESFPGLVTYSWDAVTLSGWASTYNPGHCGEDASTLAAPITLTRTGPPAAPAPTTPETGAPLPAES